MIDFIIDDLTGSAIRALLADHKNQMHKHSPPESRHVLDVKSLQQPEITFWSMWDDHELMGCVALKHWDNSFGEIKSMKAKPNQARKGIGSLLLKHVIKVAKERGYAQLKLETGAMDYFQPARNLYCKFGFVACQPFADYKRDKNNVYLQLNL